MTMDEDFLLALQLQEEYNHEASGSWGNGDDVGRESKKRRVESKSELVSYPSTPFHPERPLSIVDESWEILDPSPDVRAMFLQFNDLFFWGKLSGVEVKWSPRMTLCAGVCSYEGRGGLCSIRLSEPLLKLRPRRDLVQTLLHEMIHALLFVTQNNRDRDGHGPEFCKHMNRINVASGTKITVYHSFHDEVDQYRQHWWRCGGPCQTRRPFFGYVKRAMNRAPSAQDPWWAEHQRTCGGTYIKIKEPEDYGKKGKKGEKGKKSGTQTAQKDKSSGTQPAEKEKSAGRQTAVKGKSSSTATGVSGSQDIKMLIPFTGKGFVLGGSSQTLSSRDNTNPPAALKGSPKPIGSPGANMGLEERPGQKSPFRSSSTASVVPNSGPFPAKQAPVGKRSVGNTRVFISVNGSPVRISTTNGQLKRPPHNPSHLAGARQRSVQDLFSAKGLKSPERPGVSASIAAPPQPRGSGTQGQSNETKKGSSFMNGLSSIDLTQQERGASGSAKDMKKDNPQNQGHPREKDADAFEPLNSKYFKSPEKAAGGLPNSRKRPRHEGGSMHIFDFFQKTTKEWDKPSTPKTSSGGTTASTSAPPVQPGPLSSASLTVSCPVCHTRVLESKINEHLDTCLV
ncbi:SPRTN protein, partial [Amia calva]|nr:SPRTN protein [Amia calva]